MLPLERFKRNLKSKERPKPVSGKQVRRKSSLKMFHVEAANVGTTAALDLPENINIDSANKEEADNSNEALQYIIESLKLPEYTDVPKDAIEEVMFASDFFFAQIAYNNKLRFRQNTSHCTTYPEDSTTSIRIMRDFLNYRSLSDKKVSFAKIMAYGLGLIICGEFGGWNTGIKIAGYGGFWIANVIALVFFFAVCMCSAELSSAIQVQGGPMAYARAVMGNSMGFFLGHSLNIQYHAYVSLTLILFSEYTISITRIDHLYSILIWIGVLLPVVIFFRNGKYTWSTALVLCGVSFIELLLFGIFALPFISTSHLAEGWDDGQNHLFIDGVSGIARSFRYSLWWYIAIEGITLATPYSKNPQKDIPQSFAGVYVIITICIIALTIAVPMLPPGAGALASSAYPLIDSLVAAYGRNNRYYILFMYPSVIVNLICIVWCASHQTWALSRVGYLPFSFSTTQNEEKTPHNAFLATFTMGLSVSLLTLILNEYMFKDNLVDTILSCTIFSGIISCMGLAAVYIAFYRQFPKIARPFRSPLGEYGAFFIIIIGIITLICDTGLYGSSQIGAVLYILSMGVGGFYYLVKNKMVLLPTEDILLGKLWIEQKRQTVAKFQSLAKRPTDDPLCDAVALKI
jgi:ethanolamine permease